MTCAGKPRKLKRRLLVRTKHTFETVRPVAPKLITRYALSALTQYCLIQLDPRSLQPDSDKMLPPKIYAMLVKVEMGAVGRMLERANRFGVTICHDNRTIRD